MKESSKIGTVRMLVNNAGPGELYSHSAPARRSPKCELSPLRLHSRHRRQRRFHGHDACRFCYGTLPDGGFHGQQPSRRELNRQHFFRRRSHPRRWRVLHSALFFYLILTRSPPRQVAHGTPQRRQALQGEFGASLEE